MRVRREIRSLSVEDVDLYFQGLKIMRNISSMEHGKQIYGPKFRSYDYLIVKHMVSTIHPCQDQGHLDENQITFHKALLLEFEESWLTVIRYLDPIRATTTLTGLPYWNWFVDVKANGDFLHSSLWKYWGSPYGDVDDDYCIYDPYFNQTVNNRFTPELDAVYRTATGGEVPLFVNGYGYWRSPWSPVKCSRLARNPGWILNSRMDQQRLVQVGTRSCEHASTYHNFTRCSQGLGFLHNNFDLGPHNMPHVFMGTFDDQDYGVELLSYLCNLLSLCLLLVVLPILFCRTCSTKEFRAKRLIWVMGALFAFVGMCIGGFTVHQTWPWKFWVGVPGIAVQNDALRKLFGHHRFDGTLWRNQKTMTCPTPGVCDPQVDCGNGCTYENMLMMSWTNKFTGSDFWDGSYSINENYFFSIHGFIDLLHESWIQSKNKTSNEAPTSNKCGENDVISEEMCFTGNDIGWNKHHKKHADECITHAEILQYTPYVYDVLQEEYSWSPIEPSNVECSIDRCDDPKFHIKGDIVCLNNHNKTISADSHCTNYPKPPIPVVECNCKYEQLKAKALEKHQTSNLSSQLVLDISILFSTISLTIFTVTLLRCGFSAHQHNYNPIPTR